MIPQRRRAILAQHAVAVVAVRGEPSPRSETEAIADPELTAFRAASTSTGADIEARYQTLVQGSTRRRGGEMATPRDRNGPCR